jgi:ribosomal protein S27E
MMQISQFSDVKCTRCGNFDYYNLDGRQKYFEVIKKPIINGEIIIKKCKCCGAETVVGCTTTGNSNEPITYTPAPYQEAVQSYNMAILYGISG